MNKILQALIAALAFVTNSRANIAALRKQVADLTTVNTQLHAALDAANADTALEPDMLKQIADLKAQRDQIQSDHQATLDSIAAGETKAQELATSISENPDIPITQDPTTGSITLPAAPPDPVVTVPTPQPPVDSSSSSSSGAPVLAPTISFLSGPNADQTISIPPDIAENFAALAAANNPFTYTAPGDTVAYSITREEASGSYSAEVIAPASSSSSAPNPAPAVPDPNLAPAPVGAPADTATLPSSSSSPVDSQPSESVAQPAEPSSSSAPASV